MKKKILDRLKTMYKTLGLSDRVLDSMAATLEATVTEDSQIESGCTAVENLLKSFQSDADKLRQEKSAAEKRAKELEEKGGADPAEDDDEPELIPNPKFKKPADKKPAKDDKVPAWAKGLTEKLDTALKEVSDLKAEKQQQSQHQKLQAALKEKMIDPENAMVKFAIKGKSFKDDTELTEFIDEVATTFKDAEYKEVVDGLTAGGVPKSGGKASGGKDEISPIMADYVKKVTKEKESAK